MLHQLKSKGLIIPAAMLALLFLIGLQALPVLAQSAQPTPPGVNLPVQISPLPPEGRACAAGTYKCGCGCVAVTDLVNRCGSSCTQACTNTCKGSPYQPPVTCKNACALGSCVNGKVCELNATTGCSQISAVACKTDLQGKKCAQDCIVGSCMNGLVCITNSLTGCGMPGKTKCSVQRPVPTIPAPTPAPRPTPGPVTPTPVPPSRPQTDPVPKCTTVASLCTVLGETKRDGSLISTCRSIVLTVNGKQCYRLIWVSTPAPTPTPTPRPTPTPVPQQQCQSEKGRSCMSNIYDCRVAGGLFNPSIPGCGAGTTCCVKTTPVPPTPPGACTQSCPVGSCQGGKTCVRDERTGCTSPTGPVCSTTPLPPTNTCKGAANCGVVCPDGTRFFDACPADGAFKSCTQWSAEACAKHQGGTGVIVFRKPSECLMTNTERCTDSVAMPDKSCVNTGLRCIAGDPPPPPRPPTPPTPPPSTSSSSGGTGGCEPGVAMNCDSTCVDGTYSAVKCAPKGVSQCLDWAALACKTHGGISKAGSNGGEATFRQPNECLLNASEKCNLSVANPDPTCKVTGQRCVAGISTPGACAGPATQCNAVCANGSGSANVCPGPQYNSCMTWAAEKCAKSGGLSQAGSAGDIRTFKQPTQCLDTAKDLCNNSTPIADETCAATKQRCAPLPQIVVD